MTAYIVDHSVWSKAGRCSGIGARLRDVCTNHVVLTCPPQVLEYCHSAESPADHAGCEQEMALYDAASIHPTCESVMEIQGDLWAGGYIRAAGPVDILIAGYAVANDAVVLTADRDFDLIARVEPRLRHEYLPER